jgi:hypothetical protein
LIEDKVQVTFKLLSLLDKAIHRHWGISEQSQKRFQNICLFPCSPGVSTTERYLYIVGVSNQLVTGTHIRCHFLKSGGLEGTILLELSPTLPVFLSMSKRERVTALCIHATSKFVTINMNH